MGRRVCRESSDIADMSNKIDYLTVFFSLSMSSSPLTSWLCQIWDVIYTIESPSIKIIAKVIIVLLFFIQWWFPTCSVNIYLWKKRLFSLWITLEAQLSGVSVIRVWAWTALTRLNLQCLVTKTCIFGQLGHNALYISQTWYVTNLQTPWLCLTTIFLNIKYQLFQNEFFLQYFQCIAIQY